VKKDKKNKNHKKSKSKSKTADADEDNLKEGGDGEEEKTGEVVQKASKDVAKYAENQVKQ